MRLALQTYVDAVLNVLTKTILGFSSKAKNYKTFTLTSLKMGQIACLFFAKISSLVLRTFAGAKMQEPNFTHKH
jgi:hypothetical protein